MKANDGELKKSFKKHGSYMGVAEEFGMSVQAVRERLMRLGFVSEYSTRYGKPEVKLVKGKVPLAQGYLDDLGFKKRDKLVGKWYVADGKLVFEPRKVR